MGQFRYDGLIKVDFEDRLLAHLQMVIGAKVRRGESFAFTWRDDPTLADSRTSAWIHPRAQIIYKYYGSRAPQLNRAWIDALIYTANSPTGLYVVPEPPDPGAGTR